jgi:hydrogenase maturation protease
MIEHRILIAGIGNIFFGDDGFGVEVVRRLMPRSWPKGVRVVDFGIRGLDLAYELLENYDAVILVDAMPHGSQPGTLYLLEPELDDAGQSIPGEAMLDPHSLDPWKVLQMTKSLGGELRRLYVVGCEPHPPNMDDLEMELSVPVRAAVDEAALVIESLVEKIRLGTPVEGEPAVNSL